MCPPPSTFKGFLFLTSLFLYGVQLSSKGTVSLLARCPLLERLGIMHSSGANLRIHSPKLKDLQVRGRYKKLCLYAPLLVKMHVELEHDYFKRRKRSAVCNYTKFFGSSSNLVELSGAIYFTRFLSVGILSRHTSLGFHHLKVIELSSLDFDDAKEMEVIARLIVDAPNLQKLHIKAFEVCEDEVPPACYKSYFGCAPNFTLMKLRVVSLQYVCDYPMAHGHAAYQILAWILTFKSRQWSSNVRGKAYLCQLKCGGSTKLLQ